MPDGVAQKKSVLTVLVSMILIDQSLKQLLISPRNLLENQKEFFYSCPSQCT